MSGFLANESQDKKGHPCFGFKWHHCWEHQEARLSEHLATGTLLGLEILGHTLAIFF